MRDFLVFLLFLIPFGMLAQEWPATGSTWHYTEHHFMSSDITFIKRECTGDTIINNQECKKVEVNNTLYCYDRSDIEFMYSDPNGDSIFVYEPAINDFQLLYVFSAQPGSSWDYILDNWVTQTLDTITITVDSLEPVVVNGQILDKQLVTYEGRYGDGIYTDTYYGEIIPRVGDLHYLFNLHPMYFDACDGNYTSGLRCYDGPILGQFETGIADSCEYVSLNVSLEENGQNPFACYPNPVSIGLRITNVVSGTHYSILSLDGRTVSEGCYDEEIPVHSLENGTYWIRLKETEAVLKFIKE